MLWCRQGGGRDGLLKLESRGLKANLPQLDEGGKQQQAKNNNQPTLNLVSPSKFIRETASEGWAEPLLYKSHKAIILDISKKMKFIHLRNSLCEKYQWKLRNINA